MTNYSPKTLADIVIGDEFSNDAVRYIANGNLPFPSTGKNGFLIHGPFGTGKSTLAMLMPSELEKLHGNPASPFVWSQQADDDAKVNAKIVNNLSTAVNFINVTPSKFSHYVIDELDEFSKAHQKKIRAAMNACNDNIFYFTTNNVHLIDGGIRNRCYEIHMCAALPEQWLPSVQSCSGTIAVLPLPLRLLFYPSSSLAAGRFAISWLRRTCSQRKRRTA